MSPAVLDKPRIASVDQFRGYTVAGMCLVNFLAPFLSVPAQLKHNESWFSYADSIMPSFFFVVGYSFRLTYLRRRLTTTWWQTARSYLRRSLVLFLLSFAIYGLTVDWTRWTNSGRMPPEFDAARPMPPPTQSFETLVARAQQTARDRKSTEQNSQTVLESAGRIGELVFSAKPRRPEKQADYEAAESAARAARSEADPFLGPAIERVRAWQALGSTGRMLFQWKIQAARMLKAELWETLALIAAAQLLVLPWIGFRSAIRFAVLIAFGLAHCALCAWFNWDFVYGINHNWMSQLWMTGDCRSWDGGVFGSLSWAVAILAGTLAYDLVQGATSTGASARRLFLFGAGFMLFGYLLSCLGRLYDLDSGELSALRERRSRQYAEQAWLDRLIEHYDRRLKVVRDNATKEDVEKLQARIAVLQDQRDAYPDLDLAPNPFVPAWSQARGRSLSQLLADPPFVATPRDNVDAAGGPTIEHRLWNYWMLGKRVPTLSFMTFASGFACVLYSLFVIGCDWLGFRLGVFRTFGTNALVAYFTHGMLALAVWIFVPSTAELPSALAAFVVFFTLTWLLVRQLEKRGIYIKL
ncbi:MAG TPA: heparan-alpha-glucosaminide N-acetyltransferase domain-containing protein [Planctomycetaceae bacterium]|jgi:predicted acyltransferase|nr:heparan-alpha-glucosaminide N-acetyltransferase domain-containing protein [Planctomycetaceae bacterium]